MIWLVVLFFNIFGDDFRGRSKTKTNRLFRVKFRRCAKDAEQLRFYSNKTKLTDYIISCCFFELKAKYFKTHLIKENYDFLKIQHKEPLQNLCEHAVIEDVFFSKI